MKDVVVAVSSCALTSLLFGFALIALALFWSDRR